MRATLGWYVHHHGTGHLMRFLAVRPHLDCDVVVFSSLAAPDALPARTRWVHLPVDNDEESAGFRTPQADGLLHWAPLRHRGYQSRMFTLTAEIERSGCQGFVVDVSAEVTLMSRLLGLPTAIFTQPGNRVDLPHQMAFRASASIIAPWPETVEPAGALSPWLDKVHFVGGISRFDGRAKLGTKIPGQVVVLGGGGGSAITPADLRSAAEATPDQSWTGIGIGGADTWVADPWPLLCQAETVVSLGGQNAVADLAAAGAAAIVLPQPRPFDEQLMTAQALAKSGLAVTLDRWPSAAQWPTVLAASASLHRQWSRWNVTAAAQRAASVVGELLQ